MSTDTPSTDDPDQDTDDTTTDPATNPILDDITTEYGSLQAFLDSDSVQAALEDEDITIDPPPADIQPRPDVLRGVSQRIDTGYGKLYVNINEDPDADGTAPFELFANIGNSGGFTASFTEALAKTISTALRAGVDPEELATELQGIRSPKAAWDNGDRIDSIPDAIGTALLRYLNADIDPDYPTQTTLQETTTDQPPAEPTTDTDPVDDLNTDDGTQAVDPNDDASTPGTQALIRRRRIPRMPRLREHDAVLLRRLQNVRKLRVERMLTSIL